MVCKNILLVLAHSHLYNDNDEQTRVQAVDLVRFAVCPHAFGIVHVSAIRAGLSISGHWWGDFKVVRRPDCRQAKGTS